MKGSRKGIRGRLGRRKGSGPDSENRLREQTEMVRAEARARAEGAPKKRRRRLRRGRARADRPRETRSERLRRHRGEIGELGIWIKGSLLEVRRRFRIGGREIARRARPVTRPVGRGFATVGRGIAAVLAPFGRAGRAVLAPVAPYVSRGLFLVVRAVGTVAGALASAAAAAVTWTVGVLAAAWRAVAGFAEREVTIVRTLAVLAAAGAVAMIVSQFIDYRGIAVGGDQYSGEVGTIAPVPMVGVKTTGEAHAYVLAPLGALALVLVWLTLRGRWKLGRAAALIGGIGLIVALGIDAPKGLDTGTLGDAYAGTEGRLLEGFWTEFFGSLVLLIAGLALSRYVRAERDAPSPAPPRPEPRSDSEGAPSAPRSAFGSGFGA